MEKEHIWVVGIAILFIGFILWLSWYADTLSKVCTDKGGTFLSRESKCIDVREIKL